MQAWILAARPKTLPAALVPVAIGAALADYDGVFDWSAVVLCAAFALLLQIGTNFANDYYDFQKGADTAERLGPTRAVAAGLIRPKAMRRGMWITFALSFLCGLAILIYAEMSLLWLTLVLACILSGIAYTGGPYPLAYHGWGEVFVFLFFGLLAVAGTYIAIVMVETQLLLSDIPQSIQNALWVGAGVGGLSANLLVLNNYRDAETDAKANKRTLVVRLGKTFGLIEYAAFALLAGAVPVILYLRDISPTVLLATLMLPPAGYIVIKMRTAEGRKAYDGLLAATAGILLLYGVLFAYSLSLAI